MAQAPSNQYRPLPAPQSGDPKQLASYLQQELSRLADILNSKGDSVIPSTTIAPLKVTPGMVLFADGTHWNPTGTGAGLVFWDGVQKKWRQLNNAAEIAYTTITPPPDPTNVAVTAVADGFNITCTPPDPTLVKWVEVWQNTTNNSGTATLLGHFTGTTYPIANTAGNTYFYWLRSYNTAANVGNFVPTAPTSVTSKTVQNGATNGATIGPGGNVNGAVDTNGRALVDFSMSGHLSKILDNIGDGTIYARVTTNALTSGNIDFNKTGFNNKNIDYIGDGASYARVKGTELTSGTVKQLNDGTTTRTAGDVGAAIAVGGNIQSTTKINGRSEQISTTVAKLNSSGLLVDADQIAADGATYGRTRGSTLLGGVPNWFTHTGKQAYPNAGFESNLAGIIPNFITVGQLCDNWTVQSAAGGIFGLTLENNGNARSGNGDVIIRLQQNQTIPATTHEYGAAQGALVQVHQGQKVSFGGWCNWESNAAMPAGLTATLYIVLALFDQTGTNLLTQQLTSFNTTNNGGYLPVTGNYTIPATIGGGAPAWAQLRCAVDVYNSTGAPITTSAVSLLADCRFDDLYLYIDDVTVVGGATLGDTNNVGPNNITFKNLKGDTSTDTTTSLIDTNNKRFLHATMSTGVQAVVSSGGQVNVNPSGGTTGTLPAANNGLTIAASGQRTGNEWNQTITSIAGQRYTLSGFGVSSNVNVGNNQKIVVASGTLYCGGASVAINGATTGFVFSPTDTSTYYVYYLITTPPSGTLTLTLNYTNAAGLAALANQDGVVYIGKITLPGGGGSGTGSIGGGTQTP